MTVEELVKARKESESEIDFEKLLSNVFDSLIEGHISFSEFSLNFNRDVRDPVIEMMIESIRFRC